MKIISILFTFLILPILIGCDRDQDEIISAASVENIEIYVSETGKDINIYPENGGDPYTQKLFPVVAIVKLSFSNGCDVYHDTEYPVGNLRENLSHPIWRLSDDHSDIPIWQDGNTIEVRITESAYVGSEYCDTANHYYEDLRKIRSFTCGIGSLEDSCCA